MSATATLTQSPPAAPLPLSDKQSRAHAEMANAIRALAMDAVEQGEIRPPRHADGHGRRRHRAVDAVPEIRPRRPALAGPRPLRAVGRPRLDAAVCAAASDRLRGHDDGRDPRASGSSAPRPPGHPEYGHAPPASRPPPARSARASATRSAWRWPSGSWRRASATTGRSPHLGHRRRRLPDGGHQPRGDLAGRASPAQQADRAVRRQQHLDRRADLAVRVRRPGGALQGLRLERAARRRPRPRAIAARHRGGAARRQADPDRLPHHRSAMARRPRPAPPPAHGSPLGDEEIAGARQAPRLAARALRAARPTCSSAGARPASEALRRARPGTQRLDEAAGARSAPSSTPASWPASCRKDWHQAVAALKTKLAGEKPNVATRVASRDGAGDADGRDPGDDRRLGRPDRLEQHQDQGIGAPITRGDYAGRYVHYGVREHGMAAAMNGMALHGGIIPYGGTFLVFTDYCRPAIRLSALMGQRVIYVMTHDFDRPRRGRPDPPAGGARSRRCARSRTCSSSARPTRSRRPNAGQLALERDDGPTVLALTRQNLPALRTADGDGESLRPRRL